MEDYFSFLPDPIIVLIISYLAFRDAARTSVLSQRWRHLWRSTKNIEFDETLFMREVESREERELCRRDFIYFVRQWILDYQEPVLDMFRLAFSNPKQYQLEMENCVRFAIAHGVKRLDLDFCDPAWGEYNSDEPPPSFALPSCVYRNGVLESLRLYSCSFHVSRFNTFTALKDLSIGWSELKSFALSALLVNCPLLESLSLKKCWNLDDPVISGPKLKLRSLVMDKCAFIYRFTVGAPLLRSLSYSGAVSEFVFLNQPPVEKVELDFGLEPDIDYEGTYGDVIRELLGDLKCTTLTVCSFMLQDYAPPSELRGNNVFWRQQEPVSPCMIETLRIVEMKGVGGEPNELLLVKYLLRHGHVMETLNIILKKQMGHGDADTESNSRSWAEMLQYYARASSGLQILIS
ncbi:hypothetical protein VitviT2T_029342 [Vitis vinifera]|uniref:F-box domain-containing protein n=1 Tax=Vitis vinifera TaxID=29760 RepID=A0ABY9DW24_VITVI|nr:hypothetical protein VitviT2T_029342 [Vitis vinifera]